MLNKTFTIILLASTIAAAQPKWKPITQQSKPWSRWWWEGSAVNPIDATNRERQRTTQFGDGKTPTGVASLGDMYELNERSVHVADLGASQRVTSGRIGRSTRTCTRQASTIVATKHRAMAGRNPRSAAYASNQGTVTSWTR